MCQLSEWREKIGLPESMTPWSRDMKASGVSQTERVKQLLDAVAAERLGVENLDLPWSQKQKLLKDVYCDISQNPKFKPYTSKEGITGCLSTSTMLYSFARDGAVLPFELLLFQGHRRDLKVPPSLSSNQTRDLAGEGMSLPCLGTVLWAVYLTKGFPQEQ
jgi:hypothetical protein